MEIHVKTIPINDMRYPSCGDYWYDDLGILQVRVAEMDNSFYETMVAIHEIVEELLTKHRGITEQQIMDFDLYYEKKREMGLVDEMSEPGFSNEAPYLKEHTLATSVEMMICAMAGESWMDYDQTVNAL